MTSNPTYDRSKTYEWNYAHAPDLQERSTDNRELRYEFCGIPVASPLGIAAGPLLNGHWLLSYAQAGFDVLTYKTVRSRQRDCYELPNLVPVQAMDVAPGDSLKSQAGMDGSWAISFGMPSATPQQWSQDIAMARERLPQGCVLSVSVVATPEEGWTLDDIAADYAWCAQRAVESGAQCIEANFSCPNVASRDGQLFQNADAARVVALRIRQSIGTTPLILKIGYMDDPRAAQVLVEAVSGAATALSMTNCISATVLSDEALGENAAFFGGQPRGIGGSAIRARSQKQVSMFSHAISNSPVPATQDLKIIGVGGASEAAHVSDYLAAGAHSVQLATAAMLDRAVAERIKNDFGWA